MYYSRSMPQDLHNGNDYKQSLLLTISGQIFSSNIPHLYLTMMGVKLSIFCPHRKGTLGLKHKSNPQKMSPLHYMAVGGGGLP